MLIRIPWYRFIKYFSAKLFGVGVGLLVFLLIFSGFHLEQCTGKQLIIPFCFFYGYGLLFSLLADYLSGTVRHLRSFSALVLYILGGFFPFLIGGPGLIMIAGVIGAFMSLIVLIASYLIEQHWPYSGIGAALLLLLYLGLLLS